MACSLSLAPPCQLRLLAGQEHGRTIPLTDIGPNFSLLSQFEFWRPRRWQRFISFHDVDGWQALRGLVPTLNFVHSAGAPKSKIQFNGVGGLRTYVSLTASPFQRIIEALLMSNTSVKVAIALFMVLTPPAASFARGGHGGGH